MWSRRNVDKVVALEAEGRMQDAGRAEVEVAKKDGRWGRAYSKPSDIQVPKDFEKALRGRDGAWEFFEGLGRSQRYTFLVRLEMTKTEETRGSKMGQFAEMLAEGKTL